MRNDAKTRVEWVDNGKMIAALLVIFLHVAWIFPAVRSSAMNGIVFHWTYRGDVPFFLFFAGYFLARNISWGKALKRAVLLLIPFVIWNVLYYLFHAIPADRGWQLLEDLPSVFGLGVLFTPDIHLIDAAALQPKISVSWFLRDIIILTMITPLLARCKSVLAVVLALAFFVFPNCNAHSEMYNSILAPGTCFFYFLGVFFSKHDIHEADRILNNHFTPIMVAGITLGVGLGMAIAYKVIPGMVFTLPGGLLGMLLIAHAGVLIERHCPRVSRTFSACSPACFLIFMLHAPILQIVSCFLPTWFMESALVWFTPFIVAGIIILMWMFMKRWTPWLLPVLAHDKMKR